MKEWFIKLISKAKNLFSKVPKITQEDNNITNSPNTIITGGSSNSVTNITNQNLLEKKSGKKRIEVRELLLNLYRIGAQAYDSDMLKNGISILEKMKEIRIEIEKILADDNDNEILSVKEKELLDTVIHDIYNQFHKSQVYAIAKYNKRKTTEIMDNKDMSIAKLDASFEKLRKTTLFK